LEYFESAIALTGKSLSGAAKRAIKIEGTITLLRADTATDLLNSSASRSTKPVRYWTRETGVAVRAAAIDESE
jgi:hypothetical protein